MQTLLDMDRLKKFSKHPCVRNLMNMHYQHPMVRLCKYQKSLKNKLVATIDKANEKHLSSNIHILTQSTV